MVGPAVDAGLERIGDVDPARYSVSRIDIRVGDFPFPDPQQQFGALAVTQDLLEHMVDQACQMCLGEYLGAHATILAQGSAICNRLHHQPQRNCATGGEVTGSGPAVER